MCYILIKGTNPSKGFTFVELTIVLLVIGLLFTAFLAFVSPIIKESRIIENEAKLQNIAKAINFYVSQNMRLPCPAAPLAAAANPPFGYESGSGADGDQIPATCGATADGWEGIVPFKTLGIPSDWIRDASGSYITYAISPGFAQNPNDPNVLVHNRCRTADWYNASMLYEGSMVPAPPASVRAHKNPQKARFCCSGQNIPDDLDIRDRNDIPQMGFPRDAVGATYDRTNVTFPSLLVSNVLPANNERVAAPVYALISHGDHGGSFDVNAGVVTRYALANSTPFEAVNATPGTRIYYDIPNIDRTGDERDNDDIVWWTTQDGIFSSQGLSCSLP